MPIAARDIVPLGRLRAQLSELAEDAHAGAEKVITRNGEAYVALIDAARLDHCHRLEREHIHLALLDEAERGWNDAQGGRVLSVAELRSRYGR